MVRDTVAPPRKPAVSNSLDIQAVFDLVRGAVSTRELSPVLTHFAYEAKRIHGYNGRIYLSAPLDLGDTPHFTVPAVLLCAAMDALETQAFLTPPQLEVRPATDKQSATLCISCGEFVANLPIGPIALFPTPVIPPLPDHHSKAKPAGALLPVLKTLRPFVGEDASRPWCASIRFMAGHAYATNNVVVASVPLPARFPYLDCALPVTAVEELLRMGEEPLAVLQAGQTALVCYLPYGVILRTQLIQEGWPDAQALMDQVHDNVDKRTWIPVTDALRHAVTALAPLCPDPSLPALVLEGTTVATRAGASSATVGGFKGLVGVYHPTKALEPVLVAASHVAWVKYPRVPWRGPGGLRGVLVGMVS